MRNILAILGLFAVLACVAATTSNVKAVPFGKLLFDKAIPKPPVIDVESRLVGGEAAKESMANYIVSISLSDIAYAHTCAGCIIGKEWVLTAAHCIKDLEHLSGNTAGAIGLPVYAGISDRSHLEKAQKRNIDFAFAHKGFDGSEGSDDIALLHVSQPFEFNANVRSIALPSTHDDFTGKESTTYGWGLDNVDSSSFVQDLRVARAEVINASECRTTLPSDAPVNDNTLCVRVAACYGDGGSPLVIEAGGSGLELIGLASWAYMPCGYENRPAAFMNVSRYVEWIAQVQWAHSILH